VSPLDFWTAQVLEKGDKAVIPTHTGRVIMETMPDVAKAQRKLSALVLAVAKMVEEEPEIPTAVLEIAADAIGWQLVLVRRTLEGKVEL
jgi:hypothetical protein